MSKAINLLDSSLPRKQGGGGTQIRTPSREHARFFVDRVQAAMRDPAAARHFGNSEGDLFTDVIVTLEWLELLAESRLLREGT